ncbi:aminodeoxychorismate synthase component I [Rhizobium sp. L1K21]|uniref:aminodeoxychorismate synthase component I n=1 Tax=Rhizobium sp. L1K21 TaxID=2954933 RepID=UPI0020936240|nr:aminodeoxychorismate synthase component I [Rhizobium sp. L1K21]MCO6185043.1 aminodeoxychorismate synthase component I [Rhizobium sp. L1K21]
MEAPYPPFVLLRDDLADCSMLFAAPREIIRVDRKADFFPALKRMEEAQAAGYWLAGYMSYEAGHLFEKKLARFADDGGPVPYLLFGVFDVPQTDHPLAAPRQRSENEPFISQPRAEWDAAAYAERFETLHQHLRRGDCYQGNLTFPIEASWSGDPLAGFWSLTARQPVRYGAYVNLGGPIVLSRSPELFFKVDREGWIETHPMKGTAPRGASPEEDAAIVAAMKADEKTQAENRMIVDLLRNDISRVSEVGTLDVPKLFEVETYPTLHQMISVVRAKLLSEVRLTDIFASLFPCGSVTGAPKMWAMEILAGLEAGPRGVYCGSIGYIAPDGSMRFNVAIRTIVLSEDGRARFNVGGGVVFDSTAESEYDEALLKARFAVGDQVIA